MRHLRLALRTLFKSPFVTIVAIVSLALGIGADTAIFSLFDEIRPALGRLFGADDDRTPGEPHAVVLSHDYWATRFVSDPNVIGQPLTVNGQAMTIIGVAPRGFAGTTLGGTPKVFVPLTMYGL